MDSLKPAPSPACGSRTSLRFFRLGHELVEGGHGLLDLVAAASVDRRPRIVIEQLDPHRWQVARRGWRTIGHANFAVSDPRDRNGLRRAAAPRNRQERDVSLRYPQPAALMA